MKTRRSCLGHNIGTEDLVEGKFHGWGVEYEEFENGLGNYSVAIVEIADGTTQTLIPSLVRFLDTDVAY
jgi:hypothetical protein